VRLGPTKPILGIAEGIETALAVRKATGMTVWSAISCTLMERFEPPEDTKQVFIWGDLDKNCAGQKAAEALRKRLEANGIEATVLLPPNIGMDWLDVLNQMGKGGFPVRYGRS
jgi:putative DNA primase/helicase